MRIFVTGGAGYLGSVLVPILLRNKHKVVVLDNFMFRQHSFYHELKNPDLEIVQGDARNETKVKDLMKGIDAVFPLACLTGAPICDKFPQEAHEVIIDALRVILNNRSRGQMIIYPTTNSGYGVGEKNKFCTEETPLRPVSLYGKLKVQAEKETLEAGDSITFRLATAFGVSPRMRLDLLVNDFVYKAYHDRQLKIFEGHFKRNFIHVHDVGKVFIHAITNFQKLKGQTYNVGLSNANLSKLELCEEIKKHIQDFQFVESKEGKDPDKRDYIVSNEKIEATGFKPDVSLSDGIKELITAFQSNQMKNVVYQMTNA